MHDSREREIAFIVLYLLTDNCVKNGSDFMMEAHKLCPKSLKLFTIFMQRKARRIFVSCVIHGRSWKRVHATCLEADLYNKQRKKDLCIKV